MNKMKLKILGSIIGIFIIFSCEKSESYYSQELIGTWINSNTDDTLIFNSDNSAVFNPNSLNVFRSNIYTYDYLANKKYITFEYTGPLKSWCPYNDIAYNLKSKNRILEIENLDKLCQFHGEEGTSVFNRK